MEGLPYGTALRGNVCKSMMWGSLAEVSAFGRRHAQGQEVFQRGNDRSQPRLSCLSVQYARGPSSIRQATGIAITIL